MANIRKNLVGSVLLANGTFLAAGDRVPDDQTVDPSLLEEDQQELDLDGQGDKGDPQADQGDEQGAADVTGEPQADPDADGDAQADQGSDADADEADDEDDILGTPEPAAEKPARRRSSRTRKS